MAKGLLKEAAGPEKQKPQKAGKGLPANYPQQVEQLTAMAMSIIYSDQINLEENHLPQAIEDADKMVKCPADAAATGVADVSLWVLSQVEDNVEAQGKTIKPIVVMGAIGRIVAETAELTMMAKIAELTPEDVQIAIAVAINKYIPTAKAAGKVTDAQLKEAAMALQEAYPEEAESFNAMVKARYEKQKTNCMTGQPRQGQPTPTTPTAPAEQAPPEQPAPAEQGLLQGGM